MSHYPQNVSKGNLSDYFRNNQSLISQSSSDSENGFKTETFKVKSGSKRSFLDRVSVYIC